MFDSSTVVAEGADTTVDHSDIRGSKPHSHDPSGAASDERDCRHCTATRYRVRHNSGHGTFRTLLAERLDIDGNPLTGTRSSYM